MSDDFLHGIEEVLRPPPRLSLSEWADRHMWLSVESAAESGRWRTLSYQKGVMDAITDPAVERVTWMKSARIGYTKIINAAIGYFIHQDPCPILLVQPTVEDAKGYSKEEISPMLRDVEVLARAVGAASSFNAEQTVLAKVFPGGVLTMVGANSGRGFRRVSRRVVIFDEVDGYPPSAGAEGDQIELGIRRSEYYANRKIIAGSTPLIAGQSRIEEMFESGDRRRYFVPCPNCDTYDTLVFRRESERGHYMEWPKNRPEDAYFMCRHCGCAIEDRYKRSMIARGEWRAEAEFRGHASFHLWSAYSLSPNASWGQLACEFVEANRGGVEKLKTFVNTVLGETWAERGDAPDWERLYQRRETYAIGSVPSPVVVLTAGVDVQKDRLVYEVVGWAPSKESWSIDAGELYGDTALEDTWAQLDALLARPFVRDIDQLSIAMLAVDSGYNTQVVYGWARQHPMQRVIACKGMSGARMLVGAPSPVDVTIRGRRLQHGYKVWPIGVDLAKSELYGWLRLKPGDEPPPGYCHFPEYGEEFFMQLTAEHLVTVVNRRTHRAKMEWQCLPNRDNHYLDARILARAAASVLGIDRMTPRQRANVPSSPPPAPAPRSSSWLGSGVRPAGRGWLRRR